MFIRPYFELEDVYAEVDLVDEESVWDAYDYAEEQPASELVVEAEAIVDRVDRNQIHWNWRMKNWEIDDEFDMAHQWYLQIIQGWLND